MQRRSSSKSQVTRSALKYIKVQAKAVEKIKIKRVDQQKRLKQNILFSLCHVFLQTQNNPMVIYPWMKQFHQLEESIIGTNYVIIGPSQSGKYSAVKYALGRYHPQVRQILINCDISTTQCQFFSKVLDEFRLKCPQAQWPQKQKQVNKLIVNQDIQFSRLNKYIEQIDLSFVIVIRNGQHLAGFKKQSLLYNLFEWMKSEQIKDRAGLVILTRQLMLVDRFQKRVKSRFCGNKLCIFRPEDPDIYIKILAKRIQALIEDKRTWRDENQHKDCKRQQNPQIYQSDQQLNNKSRGRPKKNTKLSQEQQIQIAYLQKIFKANFENPYVKSLNEYFITLVSYIGRKRLQQLKIDKFFYEKISNFQKFKKMKRQQELRLFSDQSILSIQQQIQCLRKLREALVKSSELRFYLKNKILEYQVITIPFVLRIFQHIFMTLDESLLHFLSVEQLKGLILQLVKKNVQYQFPMNIVECNSLQNLNSIQLLLLIIILKNIQIGEHPIKLLKLYSSHRKDIHQEIYKNCERESAKYPIKIIQRSLIRLHRSQTIKFSLDNIWNGQIELLVERQKVRKSLQQLVRQNTLSDNLLNQLRQLNICAEPGQSQTVYVNLTTDKN